MANGHYQDEKGQDAEKFHDDIDRRVSVVGERGEIVNASGHRDQLQRHYGLISICGLALTIDNAWVALGGSIAVSISKIFSIRAPDAAVLTTRQIMVDLLGFSMSFSWLAFITASLLHP